MNKKSAMNLQYTFGMRGRRPLEHFDDDTTDNTADTTETQTADDTQNNQDNQDNTVQQTDNTDAGTDGVTKSDMAPDQDESSKVVLGISRNQKNIFS